MITFAQLDPSAQAPWTSTTVAPFAVILLLLTSRPCVAPVSQRPHPVGDGPPDLIRRIFLHEMDTLNRLLGQRWPPPDDVDQPIIGKDRTWLGLQE